MTGDFPTNGGTAQINQSVLGQQCLACGLFYYGLSHVCGNGGGLAGVGQGVSWFQSAPALTVSDVESVVAKALEGHAKKYLAIIEKLADALAREK